MTNGKHTPAPPPAPRQRQTIDPRDERTPAGGSAAREEGKRDAEREEVRRRETAEDDGARRERGRDEEEGRDPERMNPEGRDPRESRHAGPMSTEKNVTTDEQRAAQEAGKGPIADTGADPETQSRTIESQRAAAENPLSPAWTPLPGGPGPGAQGLVAPPVPVGSAPGAPQPLTPPGQVPTKEQREEADRQRSGRGRRRLEEEKVTVRVRAPFTLTDDRGTQHQYQAGEQEMPQSHADHWYAREFIVDDDR